MSWLLLNGVCSMFAASWSPCLQIKHEDFMEGINVVSAKKKGSLDYYA